MYHLRDTILHAMARTLWVTAYADALENAPTRVSNKHASACFGADWADVTPPTPPGVLEEAEEWLYAFEVKHRRLIYAWLTRSAPWVFNDDDDLLETLDSFGHYLVMNMQGSGVGLRDWYDKSMAVYVVDDVDVPYREQYVSDELARELVYADEEDDDDDDDDDE